MQNYMISKAIRGATTVNSNTEQEIYDATLELLTKMVNENSINPDNIVNVIFTLTHDLDAAFPARVARSNLAWHNVPMICTQEIPVPNSLKNCIRVLITFNTEDISGKIRHIYLREAKKLRPDLVTE